MENIAFSQQELKILVNIIYGVGQTLNIPDTRLVLPILDRLEAKIKKEEPKVVEPKTPVFDDKKEVLN